MNTGPKRANIQNLRNLIDTTIFVTILLFLARATTVLSHDLDLEDPDEALELFKELKEDYKEDLEPFQKEVSDCMEQTGATKDDANNFLRKVPQTTYEGKCFVACILTKSELMKNDSIDAETYIRLNKVVYGGENEITRHLKRALDECLKADTDSVEVCERASFFSDCMNLKTRSVLQKAYKGGRGAVDPTDDMSFEEVAKMLNKEEL